MHVLCISVLGIDDEDGAASAPNVRIENRTRRPDLDFEALTDDGPPIRVENNGDLVSRRILELLHHQLSPPRRRRPVHPAQRLALLVLAHAVKLEAAVPAEQQAPPVLRALAGFGKERAELHQPRIDEQRTWRRQPDDRALETERVGELRPHVGELVPPARQVFEHVADAQPRATASQNMPLLPETADLLDERYTGGHHVSGCKQLGDDRHVIPLDVLAVAPAALHPEGTVGEPHPDPTDSHDEQQPGGDGIQRFRPERPGGQVDPEAEREDEPAAPREHG